jgi:hypothetical protein
MEDRVPDPFWLKLEEETASKGSDATTNNVEMSAAESNGAAEV